MTQSSVDTITRMENRMPAISLRLLLLFSLLMAGAARAETLHYGVFLDGKHLGDIVENTRVTARHGHQIKTIIQDTHLRAKFLFKTVFSLDSQDTSLVDEAGLLEHHSHSTVDDQVLTLHAHRLAQTLTFQFNQDGQEESSEIPLSHFDCTSLEAGFLASLAIGETTTLRVLQMDTMEIEKMVFTREKNEQLKIDGQSIACRVFRFEQKNVEGRRWYDDRSSDLLVREDGTDEDGPYSVVLNRFSGGQ